MTNSKKQNHQMWHSRQIREYKKIVGDYEYFAKALKSVLEKAKNTSIPEAIVQVRAKSIESFAEKCLRKKANYKEPYKELTDLCGGRVIVHTLSQVEAVRAFIKCNFLIEEEDEKGLSLGKDQFGYRDLHFLVQLNPERAEIIGFTKKQIDAIGDKIAELQIRTIVQHAWADTLHDRMYKTKLIYPAEFQRGGSLLAAIMEDGDRQFDQLAADIDGMLTNFNVYASREEVEKELNMQEVIYANADTSQKAKSALHLARLLAAKGDYEAVVKTLKDYIRTKPLLKFEILVEYGYALCKLHQKNPQSREFQKGQKYLKDVIEECNEKELDCIPNLRKQRSMLARSLTRLAWSYTMQQGQQREALLKYRKALETEPDNPYYLSEVVAYEISYHGRDILPPLATTLKKAVDLCHSHAENGTEIPFSYLTAGRLQLLLDDSESALVDYALGLLHLRNEKTCVPPDVFDQEIKWLNTVVGADEAKDGFRWVKQLFTIYCNLLSKKTGKIKSCSSTKLEAPVLIVAGSARIGITTKEMKQITKALATGVRGRDGIIISGGTRVGIPLCISNAVSKASRDGYSTPEVYGYLPKKLPVGEKADTRCTIIACGDNVFSPAQILCYWNDIIGSSINPSDVSLFGYGGGPISATEYAVALMCGAKVFLVRNSGRSADKILPLEAAIPNLKGVPKENASMQAVFWSDSIDDPSKPGSRMLDSKQITTMAKAFHENYCNSSTKPANLEPWTKLEKTFKKANLEQARHAIRILDQKGYRVVSRKAGGKALSAEDLQKDLETLAMLEHGRWNVERLKDGWRQGERNDKNKTHNCLIPWEKLPESIKYWDRVAVKKYPAILKSIGLKIINS